MEKISYIDFTLQRGAEVIVDTTRLVPGRVARIDSICGAQMGVLITRGTFYPYILTLRKSSDPNRFVEYDVSIDPMGLDLLK